MTAVKREDISEIDEEVSSAIKSMAEIIGHQREIQATLAKIETPDHTSDLALQNIRSDFDNISNADVGSMSREERRDHLRRVISLLRRANERLDYLVKDIDRHAVITGDTAYAATLSINITQHIVDIEVIRLAEFARTMDIARKKQIEQQKVEKFQFYLSIFMGLLGAAVAAYVVLSIFPSIQDLIISKLAGEAVSWLAPTPAYAQTTSLIPTQDQTKIIIVFLLFSMFFVFFIAMIFLAFFTDSDLIRQFAIDSLKTGFGFIIGSLAGFLSA